MCRQRYKQNTKTVKFSLLLVIFIHLTFRTFSCTCWFPTDKESVKQIINSADIIVYATALADNSIGISNFDNDSSLHITDVVFKIHTVWKGDVTGKLKLNPRKYPCEDANYRIGETFIIFGYINKDTGLLESNSCNSLNEFVRQTASDKEKARDKADYRRFKKYQTKHRRDFNSIKQIIIETQKTK